MLKIPSLQNSLILNILIIPNLFRLIEMRILAGFIKKYPIRGQLLISGTIAWASDTTLQLAKNEPFDFTRNLRFTSTFLFFLAPANLIWFRFLDANKLSPVLCVIADAIIFYPSALITLITINNFLKV